MNMKLMTAFAVASLAIAGVACSESKTTSSSEATDKVAVEAGTGGTLNLSLPGSINETQTAGGTLNLNIGGASDQPRLIGSDQLGSVNFGDDVPGPALAVGTDEVEPDDGGDDIIRLDPK
jgi:hypothetical protein